MSFKKGDQVYIKRNKDTIAHIEVCLGVTHEVDLPEDIFRTKFKISDIEVTPYPYRITYNRTYFIFNGDELVGADIYETKLYQTLYGDDR